MEFIIDNTKVPEIKNMSYDGDYLEVLFLNSTEWENVSDEHPELIEFWHGTPLADIVRRAQEDATVREALDAFVTVATDAIGISEGEEFCQEVGYDDLWGIINNALIEWAA